MGKITGLKPATGAIVKAVAMLGSSQGLGLLCSLIRNKLVAIWVGQAGVAILAIFTAITEMGGALAQQGIRTSSVASIAEAASGSRLKRVMGAVTAWGLLAGLAGAVAILIASPWLSHISFGDGSYTWAIALLPIVVIFNAFTATRQAIEQGTGRLARMAGASLAGSAAGMIVSVPLIYYLREEGLVWIVISYSVVTALAYLFPILHVGHLSLRDTRAEGLGYVRLGLWLTLSAIVSWGVSYLLVSWLMTHAGEEDAGLYQSGYTVAFRYLGIFFSAIAMEFYPRLSLTSSRMGRSPRHPSLLIAHEAGVVMKLAVPASALLILLSRPVMTLLYSATFAGAIPFMVLALAATPLRALSWCTAFTIIARSDGKAYLAIEAASGALCLGLSMGGYTIGGLAGLGAAFIAWYGAYMAMVLGFCRMRYGIKLPGKTLAYTLISTAMLTLLALAGLSIA
ncbi:MAG: oligosaccharide flippase family protein [Pseudoflavonifractor sp.]|nr:oligosaccharide flippase family protein [Alloprevotella sp.]MCM1116172.1 oligosaccharide flippase family protein [Pseudoflavonifractor sp.]